MKISEHFIRDERGNGRSFYKLKDDAPEWLGDAIQDAHGDMLPNDWIYDECYAAACAIDDESLDEDDLHSHVDGQVEIYTREVFQWAADFCLSGLWADAESETNDADSTASMVQRIQALQYYVIERIAQTMLAAVQENANESEEA